MVSGVLSRLPLFTGLSTETTALLEAGIQKRSFRRGEVIFHKGDPGSSMYLIVEGQVKIVLPSDAGEEALLGVLDKGDFFGELSLIDGQPRSATIIASEPTETIMIHRDDFLKIIHASPAVAVDMLRVLA